MLDKNDIRDALLKECDISIHLFGKLPKGSLEYRPSPGQRSTLELLRNLAHCGITGTQAMVDGNWDGYEKNEKRLREMPAEAFPTEMQRQKKELTQLFDGLTAEQFAKKEAQMINGKKGKLALALLDAPLRWMVGYRMQLFLYAKAAGNKDISTTNCWEGMDAPKK